MSLSEYAVMFVLVAIMGGGIPGPGDASLIAAGALAGEGKLNIWIVLATAMVAWVLGSAIGFVIGARGGRPLLDHTGRLEKRRRIHRRLKPHRTDQGLRRGGQAYACKARPRCLRRCPGVAVAALDPPAHRVDRGQRGLRRTAGPPRPGATRMNAFAILLTHVNSGAGSRPRSRTDLNGADARIGIY